MIGAVVCELRAENSARLPFINGRLMHAAFFQVLNENSPELGSFVHNEMNIKPFTVSFLEPAEEISSFEDKWLVRRGDKFFWRVTCLNGKILRAATEISIGEKVRAGALTLRVEKVTCNEKIRGDTGVIAVEDLITAVKNSSPVKEISFEFLSPVTFRIDDFDAPYPRAELIFASLADKWTQAEMPFTADKKVVRELAAQIRLTEWSGQSKKFYFRHDRGTLAFWGKFSYDVTTLSADIRKVFVLLAKFANFAGVGRLTGQGFGQTRVTFH